MQEFIKFIFGNLIFGDFIKILSPKIGFNHYKSLFKIACHMIILLSEENQQIQNQRLEIST